MSIQRPIDSPDREVSKRRKSVESAGKAVASAKRKPIIFDARCAQLFRLESHLATFRQVVTGETFQAFLPFDQQFAFAQSVLAKIRENEPNKKEITASDIRSECWARIESGMATPKGRRGRRLLRPSEKAGEHTGRSCSQLGSIAKRNIPDLREGYNPPEAVTCIVLVALRPQASLWMNF